MNIKVNTLKKKYSLYNMMRNSLNSMYKEVIEGLESIISLKDLIYLRENECLDNGIDVSKEKNSCDIYGEKFLYDYKKISKREKTLVMSIVFGNSLSYLLEFLKPEDIELLHPSVLDNMKKEISNTLSISTENLSKKEILEYYYKGISLGENELPYTKDMIGKSIPLSPITGIPHDELNNLSSEEKKMIMESNISDRNNMYGDKISTIKDKRYSYTVDDIKVLLLEFVHEFSATNCDNEYNMNINAIEFMDDEQILEEIDTWISENKKKEYPNTLITKEDNSPEITLEGLKSNIDLTIEKYKDGKVKANYDYDLLNSIIDEYISDNGVGLTTDNYDDLDDNYKNKVSFLARYKHESSKEANASIQAMSEMCKINEAVVNKDPSLVKDEKPYTLLTVFRPSGKDEVIIGPDYSVEKYLEDHNDPIDNFTTYNADPITVEEMKEIIEDNSSFPIYLTDYLNTRGISTSVEINHDETEDVLPCLKDHKETLQSIPENSIAKSALRTVEQHKQMSLYSPEIDPNMHIALDDYSAKKIHYIATITGVYLRDFFHIDNPEEHWETLDYNAKLFINNGAHNRCNHGKFPFNNFEANGVLIPTGDRMSREDLEIQKRIMSEKKFGYLEELYIDHHHGASGTSYLMSLTLDRKNDLHLDILRDYFNEVEPFIGVSQLTDKECIDAIKKKYKE